MKFDDIPQFPKAYYNIDVSLDFIKENFEHWNERDSPLILNPEWQRGHVWTERQQIEFMEYMLKGGETGIDLYFNCSSWGRSYNTPIYCVDGLQRITAVLGFLDNEIKVFGHYFNEFEDMRMIKKWRFRLHMLNLKSKKELLKIYLDFNSGGSPHDPRELERVKKMIDATGENETL